MDHQHPPSILASMCVWYARASANSKYWGIYVYINDEYCPGRDQRDVPNGGGRGSSGQEEKRRIDWTTDLRRTKHGASE